LIKIRFAEALSMSVADEVIEWSDSFKSGLGPLSDLAVGATSVQSALQSYTLAKRLVIDLYS
jgi:hypothetical protein